MGVTGTAGPDRPEGRGVDVVFRDLTAARQRWQNLEMAALTLGAELIEHTSVQATAARATHILEQRRRDRRPAGAVEYVAEPAPPPQPFGPRVDGAGVDRSRLESESDPNRCRQQRLLREVRADLLAVVAQCRRFRFDNPNSEADCAEKIARGVCAATEKLGTTSDAEVFRVWQRGMLLRLIEEPVRGAPPRAFAVLDAGPGRLPLTTEWDTCERRLALVSRLASAGLSPLVICDRLLTDLSMSSPLRHSLR